MLSPTFAWRVADMDRLSGSNSTRLAIDALATAHVTVIGLGSHLPDVCRRYLSSAPPVAVRAWALRGAVAAGVLPAAVLPAADGGFGAFGGAAPSPPAIVDDGFGAFGSAATESRRPVRVTSRCSI